MNKNNVYMQGDIVQKPISWHAWKMIAASKGYCKNVEQSRNIDGITVIQEYLMKEYLGNSDYLDYSELYYFLLLAVQEVCTENEIKSLFLNSLRDRMFHNRFIRVGEVLSYQDLCELLCNRLLMVQVKKHVKDNVVDLFIIYDEKDRLMNMEEADDKWLNNEVGPEEISRKKQLFQ